MASRTRRRWLGPDGGLERWVRPAEARALAAAIADLETVDELVVWADARELDRLATETRYRIRSGELAGTDPIDRDDATARAVVDLAAGRRSEAIAEWAVDHRRDLPTALATLGRCPDCEVAIDVRVYRAIYCLDHEGEERAAALGLAGIPTTRKGERGNR